MRKPNWSKWLQMRTAKLWELVALSFGVEPEQLPYESHMQDPGTYGPLPRQFRDRLSVASNHVDSGGLTRAQPGRSAPVAVVRVGEFIEWAKAIGWTMPPDLRNRPVTADELPLGWTGFDENADNYPPELDAAMQAWRAVSQMTGKRKPPKSLVRDWLDRYHPDLSTEAKRRIATVCNWKKKGGRP